MGVGGEHVCGFVSVWVVNMFMGLCQWGGSSEHVCVGGGGEHVCGFGLVWVVSFILCGFVSVGGEHVRGFVSVWVGW